jgi:small-conductance mechanosensitive channel
MGTNMDWLEDRLSNLTNYLGEFVLESVAFLAGAIAFVAFLVLVVWLGGWIRKRIGRRVAQRWKATDTATLLIENASRVVLFTLALILALGVVGVRTDALVTWIGVIVAALSIALQDVIKNFVAGFYLLIERPFGVGDRIAVVDQAGDVERIDLRVTAIRNDREESVLIPNYLLFSQIVVAHPKADRRSYDVLITDAPGDPASLEARLDKIARSALGDAGETIVSLGTVSTNGASARLTVWSPPERSQQNQLLVALNREYPDARFEIRNR